MGAICTTPLLQHCTTLVNTLVSYEPVKCEQEPLCTHMMCTLTDPLRIGHGMQQPSRAEKGLRTRTLLTDVATYFEALHNTFVAQTENRNAWLRLCGRR